MIADLRLSRPDRLTAVRLVLMFRTACVAILALAWCAGATLRSQSADNVPVLHRPLDQLLDLNVRDGLV